MNAKSISQCALFAALLVLCAWISLPVGDIAFSLQTLGVFLTLGLCGGKKGTAAIAVYLLMGAAGLPVFTGFRGGLGVLLGPSGGYLTGFLAAGLVYLCLPSSLWGFILGQLTCYLVGTAWFCFGYLQESSGLWAVLLKCVIPYLLPDAIKLRLAWHLTERIGSVYPQRGCTKL